MQGLNVISIHALLAESDLGRQSRRQDRSPISIHALLAESDTSPAAAPFRLSTFLSTLSLRRATELLAACTAIASISIHALLAESDNGHETSPYRVVISIHALLAESDAKLEGINNTLNRFLSTLSLRRATQRIKTFLARYEHFYPRSPCGERRQVLIGISAAPVFISIHALLAESDKTVKFKLDFVN